MDDSNGQQSDFGGQLVTLSNNMALNSQLMTLMVCSKNKKELMV